MSNPCCLIVDDEPGILATLVEGVERMKNPTVKCVAALSLHEAYEKLAAQHFDLCLTDMKLPDAQLPDCGGTAGIDLVKHIQQHYPEMPVAIITAYGSTETAITALKAGAFDFIAKPVNLENLRNIVRAALKPSLPTVDLEMPTLVGESTPMRELKKTIKKLARSQSPAHISGESGTGKEMVARLIHAHGSRADRPFVPVNCGAIPNELMESEFFGHKKGSFTGAIANKPGLFQAAEGGTLFLDEIADLPLDMQVKLLRAIQEKRVRPVGEHQEISVDVRILSATHKDLHALVNAGKFRQDLFYRINVIEVHVPPLRARPEDIPALVSVLLKRLVDREGDNYRATINPKALEALQSYAYPGNVRELENILERAVTLCENRCIQVTNLRLPQLTSLDISTPPAPPAPPAPHEAPNPITTPHLDSVAHHSNAVGLDPLLDKIEKERILDALQQTKWNQTKAAKFLDLTFGQFRHRMKKYQIRRK